MRNPPEPAPWATLLIALGISAGAFVALIALLTWSRIP